MPRLSKTTLEIEDVLRFGSTPSKLFIRLKLGLHSLFDGGGVDVAGETTSGDLYSAFLGDDAEFPVPPTDYVAAARTIEGENVALFQYTPTVDREMFFEATGAYEALQSLSINLYFCEIPDAISTWADLKTHVLAVDGNGVLTNALVYQEVALTVTQKATPYPMQGPFNAEAGKKYGLFIAPLATTTGFTFLTTSLVIRETK